MLDRRYVVLFFFTSVACNSTGQFGGLVGQKSKNPGSASDNASQTIINVDSAVASSEILSYSDTITAETLEDVLASLRTPDDPRGDKFFEKTGELATADLFVITQQQLTNDPIEILGYSFDSLQDWSFRLEHVFLAISDEYPTVREFREAQGIFSLDDILLEDFERNIAAAHQLIQSGTGPSDANADQAQGTDVVLGLTPGKGFGLQDWDFGSQAGAMAQAFWGAQAGQGGNVFATFFASWDQAGGAAGGSAGYSGEGGVWSGSGGASWGPDGGSWGGSGGGQGAEGGGWGGSAGGGWWPNGGTWGGSAGGGQ